jgi:hypothetical protein
MFFNGELLQNILMLLSLGAIYLGFSGFLGSLLFQFRSRLHWTLQGLMLVITLLLFMGIAMLPAWAHSLMRIQLALGYLVVLLFSLRPFRRPEWMWRSALAFRYLSLTLVLVMLWAISGETVPARLFLAPWAALAALLAWHRSREPIEKRPQAQANLPGPPEQSETPATNSAG